MLTNPDNEFITRLLESINNPIYVIYRILEMLLYRIENGKNVMGILVDLQEHCNRYQLCLEIDLQV